MTQMALKKQILLIFVLVPLLAGESRKAHSDVLLQFNPAQLTGTYGNTLIFNATLTNTGTSPVFLNGDTLDFDGDWSGLTVTDRFFTNAPFSLDSIGTTGAQWTGTLLEVQVSQGTLQGDYLASLTILGGADNTTQLEIARENFGVTVTKAVPAPSSALILLLGAVPGLLFLCRRSRAIN